MDLVSGIAGFIYYLVWNFNKNNYTMVSKRIVLILTVIVFLQLSCTDNPFFTDKDFSSDKLVIKGKVELSHSSDYSGVYVWLEGLNVSTYTDSEGQFNLKLSSPVSLPGGAAAWNGVYKLYYYVANYRFEFSSVLIRNGKVEYGNYDVNDNGTINKTIQLTEILGIRTTISPSSTTLGYLKGQTINLYFDTHGHTVSIDTFEPQNPFSACIIFRKIGDPNTKAVFILANINVFNTVYLIGAVDWETKLGGGEAWAIQPIPLEAGDYDVIPYLLIQQDGLPEELFLSISEYYDTFTAEYLKLPFKWQLDTFTVE